MVADLFNTVYRPLVLFLRFFPPGCVRVVVDLFNTVHYLLVLLVLCSTHSNVFVSHPDVSAWWWTYLTRCMGSVLNLVDVGAKTYLEVGE